MRKNMLNKVLVFNAVLLLVTFFVGGAFAQVMSNAELETKANDLGPRCRALGMYPNIATGTCTSSYDEYEKAYKAVFGGDDDEDDDEDEDVGNVPHTENGTQSQPAVVPETQPENNPETKAAPAPAPTPAPTATTPAPTDHDKARSNCLQKGMGYDEKTGNCVKDAEAAKQYTDNYYAERTSYCARRNLTYNRALDMCGDPIEQPNEENAAPETTNGNSGNAPSAGGADYEFSERNLAGLGLDGEDALPPEVLAAVSGSSAASSGAGSEISGGNFGMGAGGNDGESGVKGSSITITTNTDIDGKSNTEVETRDILSTSKTAEGSASNQPDIKEGNNADEEAAGEDAKKEDENKEDEKKDEEQYNGLYNGFHIIPDIMAMHCKIKGEDVAKNPDMFIDCIKQYVSEMNNSNATAKAEAEAEYEKLRYRMLVDSASTAITKAQMVGNYDDAEKDNTDAVAKMKDESGDNKGIIAYLTFVAKIMNDVRELQVENLKYTVVNGIGDIDPSIIMEEEEETEEKKAPASSGDKSGPSVNTVNVNAKIAPK